MAGGKQAEGLRASLGQASPPPPAPSCVPVSLDPWRCGSHSSTDDSCPGPGSCAQVGEMHPELGAELLRAPPPPARPWRPSPGGSSAFPELQSRGPGTCIWAGGCRAVDPSLQPLPPRPGRPAVSGRTAPSFLPAGGPCTRQARAGVCEVGGRLSPAGPGQGRGGGRAGACRWPPMGWRQGAGLGWGACLCLPQNLSWGQVRAWGLCRGARSGPGWPEKWGPFRPVSTCPSGLGPQLVPPELGQGLPGDLLELWPC